MQNGSKIKSTHGVYDVVVDGKVVAMVDRTNGDEDVIVVLVEEDGDLANPYKQRFFVNGTNEALYERVVQMKKLNIESY